MPQIPSLLVLDCTVTVPWYLTDEANALTERLFTGLGRSTYIVPVLWRLHRVHHADPELDASSGLRFHPLEILLSMAIKMAAVIALGAPAESVLVFEVLLNATSLFNHANLALPAWLDDALRLEALYGYSSFGSGEALLRQLDAPRQGARP